MDIIRTQGSNHLAIIFLKCNLYLLYSVSLNVIYSCTQILFLPLSFAVLSDCAKFDWNKLCMSPELLSLIGLFHGHCSVWRLASNCPDIMVLLQIYHWTQLVFSLNIAFSSDVHDVVIWYKKNGTSLHALLTALPCSAVLCVTYHIPHNKPRSTNDCHDKMADILYFVLGRTNMRKSSYNTCNIILICAPAAVEIHQWVTVSDVFWLHSHWARESWCSQSQH